MPDDERAYAGALARMRGLARAALADPIGLRWTGEVAPIHDGARVIAIEGRFVDGARERRAIVPLAGEDDVGPARRTLEGVGATAWIQGVGVPPPPGAVDVVEVGAWTRAHREYQAIAEAYGDRRARRSGVPLIHHIDEGVAILRRIGASAEAIAGYCVHPLVQGDDDLREAWSRGRLTGLSAAAVALAIEYRAVANAFLSPMEDHLGYADPRSIRRSPLADVDAMLIADKIQNRKDFLLHHQAHPRAERLAIYFTQWLRALEVDAPAVEALSAWITLP
ncbi:MAG: hypothetical protein R3B09_23085 [Nannocystaceae bacterium]